MSLRELDLHSVTALRKFIENSFSNSPKRKAHILAVATYCKEVAERISLLHPELPCDPDEAERAGLLHDIGYLPEIETYLDQHGTSRFVDWHPIDGANYLRARSEERLADLIEGHGNSLEVAKLQDLPLFTPSKDLIAKIVTYCDSQTGPTGERVTYRERLEEIRSRKGPSSIASRAHEASAATIMDLIEEVNELLGG